MSFYIVKSLVLIRTFITYLCITVAILLVSKSVFSGGFLSRPKQAPLIENIFSGESFDFIILEFDTDNDSLSSSDFGVSMLSFTINPISDENLYNRGLWYDYKEQIAPLVDTSVNENGLYAGVRSFFGRQHLHCSYKPLTHSLTNARRSDTNSFSSRYGLIPVMSLAYFLHDNKQFDFLPRATHPFSVVAPLLSDHAVHSIYLGVHYNPEGAIRSVHAFGNMPGLFNDLHLSMNNGILQQNTAAVTNTLEGNSMSMLLLIGLTASGRWGAFVLIFGKKYFVGIRKNLLEAIYHKKDDFDSSPPPGGAAGNIAMSSS